MLIDEGMRFCTLFSIVQRHEQGMEPEAVTLLSELKPFLRDEREVSEWPGTKLFAGMATLREYELTEPSHLVLIGAARGLYDWCQPRRPEDLVLWRAEGEPWLVSIAHERDGYLVLSPSEWGEIVERSPRLGRLASAS